MMIKKVPYWLTISISLFFGSVSALSATLPTTSYISTSNDSEIEDENSDGSIAIPTADALLGSTTYNVTYDDGSNTLGSGTFFSLFTQVSDVNAPGVWWIFSGGKLYDGDIINFSDLGESYVINSSGSYSGYLVSSALGSNIALGDESYFLETPLGNGNIILISLCCFYILFRFHRYKKQTT